MGLQQDRYEPLLSVNTTNIKDLEVLEMSETKERTTPAPVDAPLPVVATPPQHVQQLHFQQFQQHQQMQFHQFQQQQQHQQQQHQQHMPSPQPPIDPAIVFHQYASPSIPKEHLVNDHQPLRSIDPAIMFSTSQMHNLPIETQPKPLNPSSLFQPTDEKSQSAPFQDPAIISFTPSPTMTTTPVASNDTQKPKKPLFGGKKSQRNVKETVVFEDYAEFEQGNKKQTKPKQSKKIVQKMEQLSLDKQQPIPTSLIPPHVKRTNTPPHPTVILTVSGGEPVQAVNSSQMEIVRSVAAELGLSRTQLVEDGAFGISMMALKAIGGHRRIQPDNHNAAPVVVIMAGPTSIGEFGIAAARHLANRGCQVIISIAEDIYCGATVHQYKELAKFSGARIVYSLEELPDPYTTPVDLIIDTLLGADMLKITPAIKKQIHWANNNKAPVLSIEFPSGLNPNDGKAMDHLHIHPKWTLCLSAPFTGCTSRNVTGELFVADTGLPFHCFEKVVPNFHIPWGNEFVLALEYASPLK
ncbi:YjeF N-terminal domain-containing protein [Choanephora cucurbitarum]|nr:YjeF N-terminal domain-containing protein [Choanephora cucurbitarum]